MTHRLYDEVTHTFFSSDHFLCLNGYFNICKEIKSFKNVSKQDMCFILQPLMPSFVVTVHGIDQCRPLSRVSSLRLCQTRIGPE